jgi:hypothetical protein
MTVVVKQWSGRPVSHPSDHAVRQVGEIGTQPRRRHPLLLLCGSERSEVVALGAGAAATELVAQRLDDLCADGSGRATPTGKVVAKMLQKGVLIVHRAFFVRPKMYYFIVLFQSAKVAVPTWSSSDMRRMPSDEQAV